MDNPCEATSGRGEGGGIAPLDLGLALVGEGLRLCQLRLQGAPLQLRLPGPLRHLRRLVPQQHYLIHLSSPPFQPPSRTRLAGVTPASSSLPYLRTPATALASEAWSMWTALSRAPGAWNGEHVVPKLVTLSVAWP